MKGFKYFEDTALEMHNPEIQAWKAAGKGVIGTTCSNIPEEVLYAAGLLLLRLCAPKIQETEAFDDYKMK